MTLKHWLQFVRPLGVVPEDAGGGVPATPPADLGLEAQETPYEADDPELDAAMEGLAGEPAPTGGEPTPTPPQVAPPPMELAPPAVAPVPETPPVAPAVVVLPPAVPAASPTPPVAAPLAPAPEVPLQPQPVSYVPAPTPAPALAPVLAPAPAPAAPGKTLEQEETERSELRTKYLGELEANYKVPDEDRDALLTSPETVLPKLAARVHLEVQEQTIKTIIGALPQIIGNYLMAERVNQERQQQFFGTWPALNDVAGKQTVERLLRAYPVAPGTTQEQVTREVGIAAMTILQRPIQPLTTHAAPATPSAPAAPFVPAGPGGAGGGAGSRPQLGVWEGLAEELLHEDR